MWSRMKVLVEMWWTISCLFFIIGSKGLVLASTDGCPINGQPLPYKTSSPITLDTCAAQRLNVTSPLTLKTGLFDILWLRNTGKGIESVSNNIGTYLTGGPLCNDVYASNRIRFYINQNGTRSAHQIDGDGASLEVVIYFYNTKYKTFENALLHRDGMVAISNLVKVGSVPNPLFIPIQLILDYGLLARPGSMVPLINFFVYGWFDIANFVREYFVYPASFTDFENGREFDCLTSIVITPDLPHISKKQFQAFKNVLGDDGSPIQTVASLKPQGPRPVFLVDDDFHQMFKLF